MVLQALPMSLLSGAAPQVVLGFTFCACSFDLTQGNFGSGQPKHRMKFSEFISQIEQGETKQQQLEIHIVVYEQAVTNST